MKDKIVLKFNNYYFINYLRLDFLITFLKQSFSYEKIPGKCNFISLLCRHSINIYSVQGQGVRTGRKMNKKFLPKESLTFKTLNSLIFFQ